MKTQEIYYAHSRCIYDTIREMNEYAFLYDYYSPQKVINPAFLPFKGMKKYLEYVSHCNEVVASELDGYIGKGVFCEIARAMSDGIPVKVLRKKGKEYTLESVTGIQVLNQHDWKVKYGKILTF
jgi:hypothetical protein